MLHDQTFNNVYVMNPQSANSLTPERSVASPTTAYKLATRPAIQAVKVWMAKEIFSI